MIGIHQPSISLCWEKGQEKWPIGKEYPLSLALPHRGRERKLSLGMVKKLIVAILLTGGGMVFLVSAGWGTESRSRFDILMERAKTFEESGLFTVAREQYIHLEKMAPGNKNLRDARLKLAFQEEEVRFQNGVRAFELEAFEMAAMEMESLLKINPKNIPAKKLLKKVQAELKIKNGLKELVAHDYNAGLEFYQNEKFELALGQFVKVVNVVPDHKGALRYIEKIGHRINKNK